MPMSANPARKTDHFERSHVQLTVRPHARTVSVEASLAGVPMCMSEGWHKP
jgi:hypothetical protein